MAGDAVAQSRAHAELVELAELLGAPVYTEFVPSTASFPASHPLFRGSMIRLAPDVRKVLDQYDVLFSVGGDLFTLSLPSDVDPMPPAIKLIHLDVDPWELGKNYPPAVAILGDPKGTLPDIIAAVRARMTSSTRGAARERFTAATKAIAIEREALAAKARALTQATPVQPLALLHAIGEMLPKDAVVIEEALSSAAGIRQLIRSDDPQSYFGLRGGGIGWGLPATIGVKLALPGACRSQDRLRLACAFARRRGGTCQDSARDHRFDRTGVQERRADADRRRARSRVQADVIAFVSGRE
jgi:benzoylformate decarboxylase